MTYAKHLMFLYLLVSSLYVWADQPVKSKRTCIRELTAFAAPSKLNEQARRELLPLITKLTHPIWPEVIDKMTSIEVDGQKEILPAALLHAEWLVQISYEYFVMANPVLGFHAYKAALQHEIGHAIFLANMSRYSPAWARYYRQISSDTLTSFMRRVAFYAHKPTLLFELSEPYQELFADLLPVLSSRDPEIIVFTVNHIGFGERSLGRSFSTNIGHIDLGRDDNYEALRTVRRYLWQEYFVDDKNVGHEAKIVAIIFDVLAREIIEREGDPDLHELDPNMMNDRLIKRLTEALRIYR